VIRQKKNNQIMLVSYFWSNNGAIGAKIKMNHLMKVDCTNKK